MEEREREEREGSRKEGEDETEQDQKGEGGVEWERGAGLSFLPCKGISHCP